MSANAKHPIPEKGVVLLERLLQADGVHPIHRTAAHPSTVRRLKHAHLIQSYGPPNKSGQRPYIELTPFGRAIAPSL